MRCAELSQATGYGAAVPTTSLIGRLRALAARLWREVAAFGLVGALAFVVDMGGYNLLVFGLPGPGDGPMHGIPGRASVTATAIATLFSWVGNRYLTYRDQRRDKAHHELMLFLLFNAIALVITFACLYLSRYALDQHSQLADNVARFVGIGLGTVFRFLTYRRWVFAGKAAEDDELTEHTHVV